MNPAPPVLKPSPWRRWAWALVVIPVGLAVWLLGANDPVETKIYPPCGFHKATGLLCPGCGGLRSTHHLANGRLGQAFQNHPGFVLALPFLLPLVSVWIWHRVRNDEETLRTRMIYDRALKMALILFFVPALLRNLPGPFQNFAPPPVAKVAPSK
ncbi:MAG: hypothetical protein CMO74_10070 [Verrucomicrobiales bacterium]|nr:hypothetical protein [Verrucomicrobiales bacterium]|tara:strand:+ start:26071 stop:26535 length:465 start_codon:yes stop_codon:yes gene_type:complete